MGIKSLHIDNLWNKYRIDWNLFPDVNILVGMNGSGKSTVLELIESFIEGRKVKSFDKTTIKMSSSAEMEKALLISSFDQKLRNKGRIRAEESSLDYELDALLSQRDAKVYSLTDYRLSMTEEGEEKLTQFFEVVNSFFQDSQKRMFLEKGNPRVCFEVEDVRIEQNKLSAGEKQLLILLLNVFFAKVQGISVLLLDEPEISLDVEWQHKLIEKIQILNPDLQLIISTHSPSIFGDGWSDKLVWMEDIKKEKSHA